MVGAAPYELLPIRMARADSPDMVFTDIPAQLDSTAAFTPGGAWWAYAFAETDRMPKNDVPNISAMAMPWAFNLAINAELLPSQSVFRRRVAENLAEFDALLAAHGGLQFQALLKLEHQPRFYNWIPVCLMEPGAFTATTLLKAVESLQIEYTDDREQWIKRIGQLRPDLSTAQWEHMSSRNVRFNLALRLVRPFRQEDTFWSLPYAEQLPLFNEECRRLKPFIDFLRYR